MNNFAIETAQSLFENMLNVPQSELGTTVMRFREEVKNLGEPEQFAVTGDLVLRVQELAWDLGNNFGLDCMNLDELEFNLLDFESEARFRLVHALPVSLAERCAELCSVPRELL